jgi:hypothetical protein
MSVILVPELALLASCHRLSTSIAPLACRLCPGDEEASSGQAADNYLAFPRLFDEMPTSTLAELI